MSETFTAEQVAEHNSRDDIWFAIHGKVYDVTGFMDEHPGGEEVLLEHAGHDATQAFEDVGHSTDAVAMLADYLKGTLEGAASMAGKTEDVSSRAHTRAKEAPSSIVSYAIPIALVVAAVAYRYAMQAHA